MLSGGEIKSISSCCFWRSFFLGECIPSLQATNKRMKAVQVKFNFKNFFNLSLIFIIVFKNFLLDFQPTCQQICHFLFQKNDIDQI